MRFRFWGCLFHGFEGLSVLGYSTLGTGNPQPIDRGTSCFSCLGFNSSVATKCPMPQRTLRHMSYRADRVQGLRYSLNLLRDGIQGIIYRSIIGVYQGDDFRQWLIGLSGPDLGVM